MSDVEFRLNTSCYLLKSISVFVSITPVRRQCGKIWKVFSRQFFARLIYHFVLYRKRIEKEKRMRQAKQNKEDEAKRKKADLEEKMRKKEETSGSFTLISL